jgi:sugar phosphate isomerase/epimerase
VNLDPANLVMVLNEDPVKAVYTLKDHIVHTHAKDGVHFCKCDPQKVYDAFAEGGFERLVAETGTLFAEVPLGQGSVNWKQYLAALKAISFNGFLTVERETGASPDKDIKLAIDFLKTQILKTE